MGKLKVNANTINHNETENSTKRARGGHGGKNGHYQYSIYWDKSNYAVSLWEQRFDHCHVKWKAKKIGKPTNIDED